MNFAVIRTYNRDLAESITNTFQPITSVPVGVPEATAVLCNGGAVRVLALGFAIVSVVFVGKAVLRAATASFSDAMYSLGAALLPGVYLIWLGSSAQSTCISRQIGTVLQSFWAIGFTIVNAIG